MTISLEDKGLLVIPGKDDHKNEIYDGQIYYLKHRKYSDGGEHINLCAIFNELKELNLKPIGSGYYAFPKSFNKDGYAVIFNSSNCIDDKHYLICFLPTKLSIKQIEAFESIEDELFDKFNHSVLYCSTLVYYEDELPYETTVPDYRDLELESRLDGISCNDAISLLYNEIEYQKLKEKIKVRKCKDGSD